MMKISTDDRNRLRQLAQQQRALADSPENEIILKKWEAQAQGRRESPTVRLLFSNFRHEVITPRQECVGEAARELEAMLLETMTGRELFGDDTPIAPTFDLQWEASVQPFGLTPKVTRPNLENPQEYHIEPLIEDLEEEIDRLRGGTFHVDRAKTMERAETAQEVFGDILPVRMVMRSLTAPLTYPLVMLMGMENYYCSMYDCPEQIHTAMELACDVYERYFDYLESEGFLLPTNGISPVAQESFAFTDELPSENVTKTTQCWGFLESQETTAVSPEAFGEFVFPYQDRLVQRFGLLSYGCCERVDAIWPDYLSRWPKLRKLSVSPFNNEAQVGEYLRGSRVVFYSKPRAEFVTVRGPLDEDALRAYFKGVCEHASGCLFEIAQREVGTIYGDFSRGRRYVEIAKECVEKYWKP